MDSEQKQDEALVALTDALLRGEQPDIDDNTKELVMVVRHLSKMQPAQTSPPAELRTRLQRELSAEFERVQRAQKVLQLRQRRLVRLTSAAAVLVLVAAAALVLSGAQGGTGTEGTAVEGDVLVLLGLAAALLMVGGAVWLFRQGR